MKYFMGIFIFVCAVIEDVRTELMKSDAIPYIPNLSMWAQKV